ncbi:Universal stress protein UspA and related nucleotide-binding proteins [hydrothermal vent metagenome]|uniref:Universal stress protein UspA and related nucleotide-binding proteins n=1 Tax=hydrothermal vent metagenome TaxID=652676 RepID=A0A3B0U411_9ZZZZ
MRLNQQKPTGLPQSPDAGSIGAMNARSNRRAKGYLGDQHRKFLVVVDDTPECLVALRYASRRALHTGGGVMLLILISPADFQHWLGVEQVMRDEAEDEARAVLEKFAGEVQAVAGITPELVIRHGSATNEIVNLIEEDEAIAILVLGAGTEAEGPGPLVSMIAGALSGTFPVPVTIVPGDLADADIEALA